MSGSGNTSANSSNATGRNDALVSFLRDSPASIEALGRGLAASLSPLILSSLRSQAVAPQITQPPLSQPGGGASYGLQDQSLYHFRGGCYHGQLDQSSSSHLQGGLISGLHSQASITPPVSTPGVVGSHPSTSGHSTSLSSIHSEDSSSQVSDLGDWQHLVDYNVSDQDRRDLDELATSTRVAQETSDLITAAFNKPLEASKRSRIMERFPHPAAPLTAPPSIDKAMKVLIQKKKSIMSHDRFLSKLQRYTTDAIGPLAFLLDAIHQSQELSQEDIVEALQSAISLVGNAHCALNMERRRCILNQLNTQFLWQKRLNPGKAPCSVVTSARRQKREWIQSRASPNHLQCFFGWATPRATNPTRAREVAEKPQRIDTPLTGKKDPNGIRPQSHPRASRPP